MTETSIVKASDYDLDEVKAGEIEVSFAPMLTERKVLAKEFEAIVLLDIDEDVCKRAGRLRKDLVKVRTGIASTHKDQKHLALMYGRFVDALKNALTGPVSQMEDKLREIEEHYERFEAKRILIIRSARVEELSKIGVEDIQLPACLGEMEDDVYANYLAGVRAAYQQRKEAEAKAEKERIAKEKAEAAERERIRLENEKLKAEAETARKAAEVAEKKRKAEDAKRAKAEKARADKEAEARKKIEDAARKASEAAEAKLESERIAATAKLVAERTERERLESAEKIRVDMERKAKEETEAREKDKEHRSAVDVAIIETMMAVGGSGVSQGACVLILQAMAKNKIPNVSVNY